MRVSDEDMEKHNNKPLLKEFYMKQNVLIDELKNLDIKNTQVDQKQQQDGDSDKPADATAKTEDTSSQSGPAAAAAPAPPAHAAKSEGIYDTYYK